MATLYTWQGNSAAQIVQASAAVHNPDASLSVKNVAPGETPSGFPAYASCPVLTTKQGQNLTQLSSMISEVIGKSICTTGLEWISFAENVLTPNAAAWVYPTLGAMPNNKTAINEAKKNLLAALSHLNSALATKTFLVAERPTAVDAACVGALNLAFKQVLDKNYQKNIPHVVRWFQTCINQPEFAAFGKIALCEKEAQFDGKTFGELNKKAGGDNKKDKKKQEPKKQEKKKEAKPAPKVEAVPTEAPAEEKKKDPWAGLGGKYDMDAWKRCYSNNDTVPVAMDYFWQNFDKENYSIWFGKYKYGDEIPQPFMASNLIRGMFQRLDKMRKHSFGSVAVLQDTDKLEISGVWFWKGQDLAFNLSEDWQVDYEVYDWTKLDSENAEHRLIVQEYFAWEGKFGGKGFKDAKVYK